MQVFLREAIGVAQGDEVLFTDYAHGGKMWTGAGARERRKHIAFRAAFRAAPMVHVALSLWDTDSGTNARMDISAENVTTEGFDVVFRTWGDTRVARVRVRWMAIGAAHHDDDWPEVE
ncbi:H-type lectin domain-containing protein [Roseovarius autotrophicus]|uniref:H-type lectin domain-containing protein n=1 Tax=Roseovarius autotrophicus TaxID=2824121 RepID=UPI001B383633|nr:H-type lectin domain-containing protein [Roseovarius autotrophicus]